MKSDGESKFSQLLIGLGIGVVGGLIAAIFARKETLDGLRECSGKRLEYLNQLAGKLGETGSVIVQQVKKLLNCKGANSVEQTTAAETQAYQEDRRENLGG